MRKSILIGLLFFLWFFLHGAYANEVTRFGPEQYIRTSGQPNVYADSFSARAGTGRLIILNGSQSGNKKIDYAVSSAHVYLNGEEIFGPQNFNKNTYYLEASVNLFTENTLSIKLASKPGSYITLQVIQDIDPPTVSITALPDTIIEGESSTLTWISTHADTVTIDNGIGTVDPNGSILVSPTQTITYTITATGPGGTSAGSTIIAVLHRPVAADEQISLTEDNNAGGTLTAADEDGDTLVYSIVLNGSKGTVVITDISTGVFTYTPDSNASGIDFFTFKANDGVLDSNTATVTVEIKPVNDAPEISGIPEPGVYENKPYSFLPMAVDADGDSLTFSIANQPVWAGFDTSTGLLSGTPTHAHVGTTTRIVIAVSDGELGSFLPAFDLTVIDPDVDRDGIDDLDEVNIYHTNPNALDSDNDGINDGDELAYWGDNWNVDYDGDGLTNLIDADADNDGMPDGWELQNGLDLSINDADQDGDGDGVVNAAEFKLKMNPNDPDESLTVTVQYEYDSQGGIRKAASTLGN